MPLFLAAALVFCLIPLIASFEVRLVGGREEYEGRVEVRIQNSAENAWGTVCDDRWDYLDANVVCRQLGYQRAQYVYQASHFGAGSGFIFMDEVHCTGEEASLLDCEFDGWKKHNCNHREDAGVRCYVPPGRKKTVKILAARLAGGRTSQEGRVEVFYRGTWSAVDGTGFGATESAVVCGQLGYPYGQRTYGRGGQWNGTVTMLQTTCTGREVVLSHCRAVSWEHRSRNGVGWNVMDLAHVRCSKMGFQEWNKVNVQLSQATVRFRGGVGPWEGRVEVHKAGEWGTVCERGFNVDAANVVCRQAGYGTVKRILNRAWFGRGLGLINFPGVQCAGNETSLVECKPSSDPYSPYICKHWMDAGVICNKPEVPKNVRLVGSDGLHGFVEVLSREGTWHPVCDPDWSLSEARVLCRELELGYGLSGRRRSFTRPLYQMTNYKCTGEEQTLTNCKRKESKLSPQCSAGVAWISCAVALPDLIPDPEALRVSLRQYLHKVTLSTMQCAVEERCFSTLHRNQTTNGKSTRNLLRFTTRILNLGRSAFEPHAGRSEWHWHQCHQHYHSFEEFTLYDVLDSMGRRQVEGHKASFCLEDSDCLEHGPAPRQIYHCRGGHQGISANCADTYKRHLDCQWVDVTGLRPGKYKLVIRVNPNKKVAEINYNNNDVFCEFQYEGEREFVEVGNCGFMRP
eukprot:m.41948 g.41948  ORF g.41948 m.41948 type:complete len:684 (+) comp33309_c0_seq1:56-2107(+)